MSRVGDTGGNIGSTGTTGTSGGASGQIDAVKEKAADVGQNLREMGQQARETAGQRYEELKTQAEDYYHQGRERAMEWEQGLEDYVHEKPLQAVLIAAGIGVVLGLLWKRS